MPDKFTGFDARTYRLTPDVRLRLASEGLKPRTLLLLDALVDHDWAVNGKRKGQVWPKNETLARKVGVTERTVRTHLGFLIRAGLIAREGNGGRGCPAVVALNWPRIVGENPDHPIPLPAKTRIVAAAPKKPSKTENQQKAAAAAGALASAPPRRVERNALPDAVPPPPEVKAAINILLGRIGSLPAPSRPTQAVVGPSRNALVFTDRAAREAWADAQLARARELGLG